MDSTYVLRINTAPENIAALNSILEVVPTQIEPYWEIVIDESSDSYMNAIDHFLDLIEPKISMMETIGINRDDLSIWYYYQYDDQCNMEFGPKQLKRIGENGVALCISCWQKSSTTLL